MSVDLDLVLRHCAALKASVTQQQVGLELIGSQLDGLIAYAKTQDAPKAVIALPGTCREHKEEDCARCCPEEAAIEMGGMGGNPVQVMCRGCGLDPRTPVS